MLAATGRHPWRPAHIHMIVRAAGYEAVTTHIFDRASDYLDSDAVFAVKPSLLRDFVPPAADDPERPDGVDGPWFLVLNDLVLRAPRTTEPASSPPPPGCRRPSGIYSLRRGFRLCGSPEQETTEPGRSAGVERLDLGAAEPRHVGLYVVADSVWRKAGPVALREPLEEAR